MPRKVSSVYSSKINLQEFNICRYCNNKALPMRYKGNIVSHYVCTKCGKISVNEKNPFLLSKETTQLDRRSDHTLIKSKSHNIIDDTDTIGIVKREYKKPVERLSQGKEIEIVTIVKNPNDVINTINRSLNQLEYRKHELDRDMRLKFRELFKRSPP